jgi:hypothetical protein
MITTEQPPNLATPIGKIISEKRSPLIPRRDDRIAIEIKYPFWFGAKEVWNFKREHILFVVAYSDMLMQGKYPPEHGVIDYFDGECKTLNQSCLFEKCIDLLTEVCRRLDRCGVKEGTAGDLLWHDVVEQFGNGYLQVEPDAHRLCGYFRLRPSAVLALEYCCGIDAKDENFYHWKHRKKEQNIPAKIISNNI